MSAVNRKMGNTSKEMDYKNNSSASPKFRKPLKNCFNGSSTTCKSFLQLYRKSQLSGWKRKRRSNPTTINGTRRHFPKITILTSYQLMGNSFYGPERNISTSSLNTTFPHDFHANVDKAITLLGTPLALSLFTFLLICGVLLCVIKTHQMLLLRRYRREFRMRRFQANNGAAVAVHNSPGVSVPLASSSQKNGFETAKRYTRLSKSPASLDLHSSLRSAIENLIQTCRVPLKFPEDTMEGRTNPKLDQVDDQTFKLVTFSPINCPRKMECCSENLPANTNNDPEILLREIHANYGQEDANVQDGMLGEEIVLGRQYRQADVYAAA